MLEIMEQPPNALVVRLESPEAQDLADYASIFQELRAGAALCKRLGPLLDDADRDSELSEALWTAALVRYARCFTSGKRVRLRDEVFQGSAGDPKGAHQIHINMRAKLIAHSVNPYEQIMAGAVLDMSTPETRAVSGVATFTGKLVATSKDGVDTLGRLATVIGNRVAKNAEERTVAAHKVVAEMHIEELYRRGELKFVAPGPNDTGKAR